MGILNVLTICISTQHTVPFFTKRLPEVQQGSCPVSATSQVRLILWQNDTNLYPMGWLLPGIPLVQKEEAPFWLLKLFWALYEPSGQNMTWLRLQWGRASLLLTPPFCSSIKPGRILPKIFNRNVFFL